MTSVVPSDSSFIRNESNNMCKTKNKNDRSSVMTKPFFIMDWLDEINPDDLEVARQILRTPQKRKLNLKKTTPSSADSTATLATLDEINEDLFSSIASFSSMSSICSISISNSENDNQAVVSPIKSPTHRVAISSDSRDSNHSCISPTQGEERQPEEVSVRRTPSSTNINNNSNSSSRPPTAPNRTDSTTNAIRKSSQKSKHLSPFKRRSIAIGNGWNAKGLQKAKQEKWKEALSCWENALEIRTQVLGTNHPDVANTHNNIGIALGKLNQCDAAVESLQRALYIRTAGFGADSEEVAATIHNIGNVLHQATNREGAIQCFLQCKAIREKLFGSDHIQIARCCVAMGNVYFEATHYLDAMEAYSDALKIFFKIGKSAESVEVAAVKKDLRDITEIITGSSLVQ